VANEFFDPDLGRMGGFGWGALNAARTFVRRPELAIRPIFISGQYSTDGNAVMRSNGIPLLLRQNSPEEWRRRLRPREIDLLLTIEYRPAYRPILEAIADVPIIVWVRDPRPPEDDRKIQTLEVPGEKTQPKGIPLIDCRSLGAIAADSHESGRLLVFGSPAPSYLGPKTSGAYGFDVPHVELLPNPIEVVRGRTAKTRYPTVVSLGRLDPVKRPWLVLELAKRFRHVEFLLLGQPHFTGGGSGRRRLSRLPRNVRALSHVDGVEKLRLVASAWALLNTSIHEAFPVSFMEALHCGTPLVSCQDPEGVVSRFGVYVGRWDGSGMESLSAFAEGLDRVLTDDELRARLGRAGRAWIRRRHTPDRFVRHFIRLADPLVPGAHAR